MEIHYCAKCKKRVSSYDIEEGGGIERDGDVYCQACAQELSPVPKKKRKKPISSTARRAPISSTAQKPAVSKKSPSQAKRIHSRRLPSESQGRHHSSAGLLVAVFTIISALLALFILFIIFHSPEKAEQSVTEPPLQQTEQQSRPQPEPPDPPSPAPPALKAEDDTAVTNEDTEVMINPLANDRGQAFSLISTGTADHGSVTQEGPMVRYRPSPDFHGTDTFVYTISDTRGGRSRGTVSVTVKPVNDPPALSNLTLTGEAGKPVTINLEASDPDSSEMLYSVVTPPEHGTLSGIIPNLIYIPGDGFTGEDRFTVKADDGTAESGTADIRITITERTILKQPEPEPEPRKVSDRDLKKGLAGYWKFDEGRGNLSADSSGNGHNAVLIERPSWVPGKQGKALSFNKEKKRVKIRDFDYGSDGTFTVAFWFNSSDLSGTHYQYIFSHGAYNSANSVNVLLGEGGSKCPGILRTVMRDVNDGNHQGALDVNGTWNDGVWHHYALVVSATGSKVYIDGKARNSSSQGGDALNPSKALYLGCREDLTRYYGGKLDNVRVYRRVLKPEEIRSLAAMFSRTSTETDETGNKQSHDTGSGPKPEQKPVQQKTRHTEQSLNRGLRGYWKFDEGRGTRSADSSGNGHNAVLKKGASWGAGVRGTCLVFDGSDDHADMGKTDVFNPGSGKMTWSVWFRAEKGGTLMSFVGGNGSFSHGFFLLHVGKKSRRVMFKAEKSSKCTVFSPGPLADGRWHHAAATWDFSRKKAELFIDGVSAGTEINPNIIHPPSKQTEKSLSAGLLHYAGRDRFPFTGSVDEIRIYNRILTPDEIRILAGTPAR